MPFTQFVQSPPTDYFSGQALAVGESALPRINCGTGITLVSGTIHLSFWQAVKTEPVNTLFTTTAGTAAAATPTLCRIGIYSVDANSNLTLIGACANDTTIWNTTFARFNRANTTPFLKVQGQRYAHAVIIVTAVAAPVMRGYNGSIVDSNQLPFLGGQLAGQTDLLPTIANGVYSTISSMSYGGTTP